MRVVTDDKSHAVGRPRGSFCLLRVSAWLILGSLIPATAVEVREHARMITFGINARDYVEIATALYEDIALTQNIPMDGSKTIALGPVDTDGTIYFFDPRSLQESLETILHRSGSLQFSYAVDTLGGRDAAEERYRIMQLEWDKTDRIPDDILFAIGDLATIDYILFGRVSALSSESGSRLEVTHTFNWKLGDVRTGLLVWQGEHRRVKSGVAPQRPEWVTHPRGDSASYYYEQASARSSLGSELARAQALESAAEQLAGRLNARLGGDASLFPSLTPTSLAVEIAPQGIHYSQQRGRHEVHLVARVPWASLAERENTIEEITAQWQEISAITSGINFADPSPQATERIRLARTALQGMLDRYPIGGQDLVRSERFAERLAEWEAQRNNPCGARIFYGQIAERSQDTDWVRRAQTSMEQYPCRPEEMKNAILMNLFDGARVAIQTQLKLDDKAATDWPAMATALARAVSESRGIPERQTQSGTAPTQYVIIAQAEGHMATRDNAAALYGKDFQFRGRIRYDVRTAHGTSLVQDDYDIVMGWNRYGAANSIELMALLQSERILNALLRQQGYQE